jgi:putative endonuclease
MVCWVYVLRDAKGRNYVGITARLRRRIGEHNAGRRRGDRGRGPFTLVYKEACEDHPSARAREKFLKSGAGRTWLKQRLADDQPSADGGLGMPDEI